MSCQLPCLTLLLFSQKIFNSFIPMPYTLFTYVVFFFMPFSFKLTLRFTTALLGEYTKNCIFLGKGLLKSGCLDWKNSPKNSLIKVFAKDSMAYWDCYSNLFSFLKHNASTICHATICFTRKVWRRYTLSCFSLFSKDFLILFSITKTEY